MKTTLISIFLWTSLSVPLALAGDAPDAEVLPREKLTDVLEAVRRNSGKTFLVDHRAVADIVTGQLEIRNIDYPALLVILRNNELAAVTVENVVNIVPEPMIRQHSLPLLHGPDDNIADEEWVTWVVPVTVGNPAMYVPILRPLLPQAGHLAAHPGSGTITIVDRYANARRIVEMIRMMEERTAT